MAQTMVGRRLIAGERVLPHYQGVGFARRREILRETVTAFSEAEPPDRYHRIASRNLERWRAEAGPAPATPDLRVLPGDWGATTHQLTRSYGHIFAVLNMANAYVPGGGYVEGCPAQEENMFRRTDCHFSVTEAEMDPVRQRYHSAETDLLNAVGGRVYLDTQRPRVCVRGPEDRQRADLGYEWLAEDEIFPFYELRAAARDLRDGSTFEPVDAHRRIGAQLDTLAAANVEHVVLSAFGCGAFRNPAGRIAETYRKELDKRGDAFQCVAFAIFHPGYGPDNFSPFRDVLLSEHKL